MSIQISEPEEKKISHKQYKTDKNITKLKQLQINPLKKSHTKLYYNPHKKVSLLKSPSNRRKSSQNELRLKNKNKIIWDNKTIEEQYLDRKLNPRIKKYEHKTSYPKGDETDIYQEGINKLNEIKPTEELVNNIVNSLKEINKNIDNSSGASDFMGKSLKNEYLNTFTFFNENKKKFEELEEERKLTLQNTFINKFQKEVRNISNGYY